jgi:lipopolysaccharide transport system permease protein
VNHSLEWAENKATSSRLPQLRLGELRAYRGLVRFLVLRDLQVRYRQTFFGVAWAVIQPLAGAAIFTLVLGRLTDLPSDGIPYAVFVYGGLVVWTYLSQAVSEAADSLVGNKALVTKVYFPRILAPAAAVLPHLLDLLLSLPFLVALMIVSSVSPGPAVVLFPLLLLLAVALAFGVGSLFAAVNVKYRDVRHALPFVVQTWLSLTPVLYPSSLVEGAWRWLYSLNPATGLLDAIRWSLFDGPVPGAYDLMSLVGGVVLVAAGVVYFQRAERQFADVI